MRDIIHRGVVSRVTFPYGSKSFTSNNGVTWGCEIENVRLEVFKERFQVLARALYLIYSA